jgi:predicted small lipoprotein YifL
MKFLQKTTLLVCLFLLLVPLWGCGEEGPMEKAGKKMDQATEDAADAAEDAADKAKELFE